MSCSWHCRSLPNLLVYATSVLATTASLSPLCKAADFTVREYLLPVETQILPEDDQINIWWQNQLTHWHFAVIASAEYATEQGKVESTPFVLTSAELVEKALSNRFGSGSRLFSLKGAVSATSLDVVDRIPRSADDRVIVYYIGHGRPSPDKKDLLLPLSGQIPGKFDNLRLSALLSALKAPKRAQVCVRCGAGVSTDFVP
jgi:hypothetical protein